MAISLAKDLRGVPLKVATPESFMPLISPLSFDGKYQNAIFIPTILV